MSTKYLVIALGLALVVLVALSRCGSSEVPATVDIEPKKKSVAGSFTAEQKLPVAEKVAVVTTPEQSAPAAVAPPPPGTPDFGPSTLPPGSGTDPAGDEWTKRYRESRAKQVAADAAATQPPDQKNNH